MVGAGAGSVNLICVSNSGSRRSKSCGSGPGNEQIRTNTVIGIYPKLSILKAIRMIVMVRHGQYNLEGKEDEERYLTDLGRKQAEQTGQRLALLYKDFATTTQVKVVVYRTYKQNNC